jgi:hypothetical protein
MRATQVTVLFSIQINFVMARFMRATHGSQSRLEKISVGGPDKPGHDEFL